MTRRLSSGVALALIPLFLIGVPRRIGAGDTPHVQAIPPATGDSLVSFVSDTQSPIFIEELILPANHNGRAREMIYTRLLADQPNGIFHLGDMIAIGFLGGTWKSTDRFLHRAAEANVPVFPTLGNHELMIFPTYGIEEFYDRFPWYSATGYAVRVGKLAVVLLNSNFDRMKARDKRIQMSWLDSTLVAFESDTTVGAVFLCCHHPPYTNSTIVSPSQEVRESFVPLYLRYPKCRLFITGHCHAFEHFHEGGKDFLVIGGGGGLQQPLLTGAERRWEDHFPLKTEKRMFHYLQCRLTGGGIELTVRMISDDFSGFRSVYSLSFPWAPVAAPEALPPAPR
jgi:hypothetical protein